MTILFYIHNSYVKLRFFAFKINFTVNYTKRRELINQASSSFALIQTNYNTNWIYQNELTLKSRPITILNLCSAYYRIQRAWEVLMDRGAAPQASWAKFCLLRLTQIHFI